MKKRKDRPQGFLPARGSFLFVPGAFKGAPKGVESFAKMAFTETHSDSSRHPLKIEPVYSTDQLLLDFGALRPSAEIVRRAGRDCEILAETVRKYPKQIRQLVAAFHPQAPTSRVHWDKTFRLAKSIGLTEDAFSRKGGGLFFLLVIAGAALLAGGCAHCGHHVKPDKKPGQR